MNDPLALEAALDFFDSFEASGVMLKKESAIILAARERLLLQREPCETCGGSGTWTNRGATEREYLEGLREEPCPRCDGSGLGDWPASLTEKLQAAIWGGVGLRDPDEETVAEIVVVALEALDAYLSSYGEAR